MNSPFQSAIEQLSSTQRQAVAWGEGAALVLAGPGVGMRMEMGLRLLDGEDGFCAGDLGFGELLEHGRLKEENDG